MHKSSCYGKTPIRVARIFGVEGRLNSVMSVTQPTNNCGAFVFVWFNHVNPWSSTFSVTIFYKCTDTDPD